MGQDAVQRRLVGARSGIVLDRPPRTGPDSVLRPAQLLEPGIADGEVMPDFVNNGLSYLGNRFVLTSAVTTDRRLVHRGPSRHDTAVAEWCALRKRKVRRLVEILVDSDQLSPKSTDVAGEDLAKMRTVVDRLCGSWRAIRCGFKGLSP